MTPPLTPPLLLHPTLPFTLQEDVLYVDPAWLADKAAHSGRSPPSRNSNPHPNLDPKAAYSGLSPPSHDGEHLAVQARSAPTMPHTRRLALTLTLPLTLPSP